MRIFVSIWMKIKSICLLGLVLGLIACAARPIESKNVSDQSGPASVDASISLIYGEGAQFELIGPKGQRVLMEITDTSILSAPPTDKDILLTTHLHNDHFSQNFADTFPGQQLFVRQDTIDLPGLSIQGIASQHSEHTWDQPKKTGGSNYIFVVEIAGLRIAHFGDIGQKRLNDAQLTALGRVDVAITQFVNSLSQMDVTNQKGYRLMDQVRPKIIIPHHGAGNEEAIGLAMTRWRVRCVPDNRITLSPRLLPDQTTVLLIGDMADYMQRTMKLDGWP